MKKLFTKTLLCLGALVLCLLACTACGGSSEPEPEVCTHEWDEGTVVEEATYYKAGEKLFTCTLCGKTKKTAIPKTDVPAVEVPEDYEHGYVVVVNRKLNYMVAYEKGENGTFNSPVRADLCSCGGEDTPLGQYPLGVRWTWATLIQHMYGQYTTRIDGDILFHSVPYGTKYDPSSLIEGEYNKLGSTASHGCVRLTVEAAKWVYENCEKGTLCIIVDNDDPCPINTTEVLKIHDKCGWDPTDTDPNNPWIDNPGYGLPENYAEAD